MGVTVGRKSVDYSFLQIFTKTVKCKKLTNIYYISKCTLRLQSLLNDALEIMQFNNDASFRADENNSVTGHATENIYRFLYVQYGLPSLRPSSQYTLRRVDATLGVF